MPYRFHDRRPRALPPVRAGAGLSLLCVATLATFAPRAHAVAFDSCPTQAFLTQGSVPQTYAVDLVTGDYTVAASDHGTSRPLNAVAFNANDRFLYAWSYELGQPVRIHADWSIESLGNANITTGNFFVGDVSIPLNKYFVYQKGARKGLYSIDLDPDSAEYLQMRRVVDGGSLFLYIYDLSFHPVSGDAYAVDKTGDLHRIDPSDGSSVNLGNVGESGTFGAGYFDAAGNLYIGRNKDGKIFRIRPESGDITAELFANGPAASTNDGSRCASAPLIAGASVDVDFGNAPDSYGTTLDSNGARHGRTANPGLYLGGGVDGESVAYVFPLSDDVQGELTSHDDGVQFVSALRAGETALAVVEASAPGYLNAWIDLDRDGGFDSDEQVLTDRPVQAGDNPLSMDLSANLSPGDTWARFRLSSSQGLEPTGGAADGEVEDLQVTLTPGAVTLATFPSENAFATIAFEDNWPFVGDYDMNDLVVHLRTTTHRVDAGIAKVELAGELVAAGASYSNGFAVALPGVRRDQVDESRIEFTINGQPVEDRSALEAGREQAILVIDEDLRRYASEGESEDCAYFRTEPSCGADIPLTFTMSVPFVAPLDVPLSGVFDPFLFATPGEWHGAHFQSPPGRSYEIHLKNRAPTEAFDQRLFANIGQDASSPDDGLYFLTDNGMPWGLAVGTRWDYPKEFQDIANAYPRFESFSTTSGAVNAHWYDRAEAQVDLLFED